MANKATPVITHTEILCRAIRSIEDEIKSQEAQVGAFPGGKELIAAYVNERLSKLEALKEMYRIETGTDYI